MRNMLRTRFKFVEARACFEEIKWSEFSVNSKFYQLVVELPEGIKDLVAKQAGI